MPTASAEEAITSNWPGVDWLQPRPAFFLRNRASKQNDLIACHDVGDGFMAQCGCVPHARCDLELREIRRYSMRL